MNYHSQEEHDHFEGAAEQSVPPQQTIMEQFKVIEDAVRELKDMMNYEAKEDLLDSIRADADDEDKRDAQEAEEKADDSEGNTSFY